MNDPTARRAASAAASAARITGGLAMVLALSLTLSGCGGGSDPAPAATCTVASVTVSAASGTIEAGASTDLTATVNASAACTGGVTWSISALGGGTFTSSGLAASFASSNEGTYIITARSADDATKQGTATVTVTPATPVCTVASVTVVAASGTIEVGGSTDLAATVDASAACTGGVTWSILPLGVGALTPRALTASFASSSEGEFIITAKSVDDATKQGSATVTVTPATPVCTVASVTVTATSSTFEAGGSTDLTATVDASAACTGGVTWSISALGGGTFTSSGLTASFVSPGEGTYTITARSVEDATRQGSATITVTPAPPACAVTGLSLLAGPPAISTGGSSILTATLTAGAACTRALQWSVTPGGTLTASGATATFTATDLAPYTVTVRSQDDLAWSASATVTVGPAVPCGQPNGSEVTHPGGTVVTADETWVGDGVTHRLPGSVSVTGAATVTIQPCAIVALDPIASILVQDSARLVAAGTGAGRFVEIGAATTGVRWGMISAVGPGALVDLRFTNVREGGETVGLPMMLSGIGAGDAAPPAPVLRVRSVEISGSGGLGVSLAWNATFTADSADLVIKDGAGYPLRANLVALGTLPSGSYTQNARKEGADEIVVHASTDLTTDMTLKDLGVPYRFEVPAVRVQPVAPAPGPVTLTIQPGVVLKFPRRPLPSGLTAPGGLFSVGTAGLTPNGAGVLHAVGTPVAPIVFTSGEAVPAAGDWQGLWLATAAGSRLDHVEIRYAGAPLTLSSGNCRPAGTSDAAALLVGNLTDQFVPSAGLLTSSTIASSAGHGISALWQAATVNAPVLTTGNTFTGNAAGRCSQTFNGLSTGGSCPVGGGCTTP